MKGHPRYHIVRIAFKKYQVDKLLLELNSAAGTMDTDEKEEELLGLIEFLEKHKEMLRDYRDWLKEKGVYSLASLWIGLKITYRSKLCLENGVNKKCQRKH